MVCSVVILSMDFIFGWKQTLKGEPDRQQMGV
jgi:hypothetical protein